jgi:hypothetical protein
MDRQSLTKNFAGLVAIIVGSSLLLNSLNIITVTNIFADYWPLLIVLAGILVIINDVRSWAVAGFLVALGGLFQLRELDIVEVEPWTVIWPLIIIFVGISLLFGRSYTGKRVSKSERDDVTAILGGTDIVNHSKHFKQSAATAIMGGAKIDLREATFDKDALIEVFSFWGGVEIIVPDNIVIRNQVNNIMAGTEVKVQQKVDKNAPVLTIAGTLIMAGVSVRNTPGAF